jgi:peptidoglycan LD-endopeptidase CwlK
MPMFSRASAARLATCKPPLVRLFTAVVREFDCTILQGKRSEAEAAETRAAGTSHTNHSKHVYPLEELSDAVDAAPYPLKWPVRTSPTYVKEVAAFYAFGGYVMGVADGLGIPIRWGADWDSDDVYLDQTFDDLPHFELVSST